MLRSVPSLSIFVETADGIQDEDPVIENEENLERTITIGDRISGEFSFVRQIDFLSIKEEDDEGGEGVEDEKRGAYNKNRNMGFEEDGERGKGFNRDGELGFGEEEMKKRQDEFDGNKKLEIAEKDEEREGFCGMENPGFEEGDACKTGFNQNETSGIGKMQGSDPKEKLGFEEEIERPASPPMHLATGLGIDKFDLYGNEITFDLPSFDDEDCDGYYKRMLQDYPLHPLLLRNYARFLEYKGDLHGAEDYYHRCTLVEPNDGEILVNYARILMRLHQDKTKASHYFERAVRASPGDSNVLAAYASFLWETNDDSDDDVDDGEEENRQGREQYEPNVAEDHNSSSMQAETEDGETMYQYAKLFWEVHCHRDMASFYFKKAVQASPNDSNILAAYARFLWETDECDDDGEEDRSGQDQVPEFSSS